MKYSSSVNSTQRICCICGHGSEYGISIFGFYSLGLSSFPAPRTTRFINVAPAYVQKYSTEVLENSVLGVLV